jgi:hypothetical protein
MRHPHKSCNCQFVNSIYINSDSHHLLIMLGMDNQVRFLAVFSARSPLYCYPQPPSQPPLFLLCVCLCLPAFQFLNDVLTRCQLHMQIGKRRRWEIATWW